jgi:hypothetical protein
MLRSLLDLMLLRGWFRLSRNRFQPTCIEVWIFPSGRRPSHSLAKNIPELAALLKSRGMDIRSMARKQPDLLLQNAGTVRLKMDALPGKYVQGPSPCLILFIHCSSHVHAC